MASVACLHRPHQEVQREHMAASHQYMRDMLLFDRDVDLELPHTFVPSEGVVFEDMEDAFGLSSTYHDVIPHECLTPAQQDMGLHHGSELNAARIRADLLDVLKEEGLSEDVPPAREGFILPVTDLEGKTHDMPVHVVNVVNTSYWTMDRYGPAIPPVLLPHRLMWRRLQHMGCQVNHVPTSIKLCYGWPWNASELISHPGRILETGSDNPVTADLMFYHVTLPSFQLAGMPNLYVSDRSLRNVVTTMKMPIKGRLLLPLLYHRLKDHMRTTYNPVQFAGVIVHHPMFKNVRALIFKRALVIVGTISKEQTMEALDTLVPPIFRCEESPETLAELAELGPEIQQLRNVNQKVVTNKRVANGQLVPPGSTKKVRRK